MHFEMPTIPDHEKRRLEAVAGPDRPLEDLVARRVGGEPLQYIEGRAAFGRLDLVVDQRVLIPRPETETLLEIAIKMVRAPGVIVDLCTGSGALALALKDAFPGASVFGSDLAPEALEVAELNRQETGLSVHLFRGDLFAPLPTALKGEVDLIVANPPYVTEADFDGLPHDVQQEPRVALVAGPTGLEIVSRIGIEASQWLRPGGVIICEIGERQGADAASSFDGLQAIVRQDLAGRDRYVVAVKP